MSSDTAAPDEDDPPETDDPVDAEAAELADSEDQREWYNAGGLSNSRCFRKQLKSGAWAYYIVVD